MKKYKIVGINDDMDTCMCCGKSGLKRVVWMVAIDPDGNPDGSPEHYGTTCAARIAGYANPTSAVTKRKVEVEAIKRADESISSAIQAIRRDHCLVVLRDQAPVGRFYILKADDESYFTGSLSILDCQLRVRDQYPIVRYLDGKMTRYDAFTAAMEAK